MDPPSIVLIICNRMDVKKPKLFYLLHFRHYETVPNSHFSFFSKKFPMSSKGPLHFFDILQQYEKGINGSSHEFDPPLGFRVLWKGILDTLKSFCFFWASNGVLTYAVPGLFIKQRKPGTCMQNSCKTTLQLQKS